MYANTRQLHVRGLCWLGVCLATVPLLVLGLHLFAAVISGLAGAGLVIPGWLHDLLSFGVFAAIFLGLAKLATRFLDRRYPHTPVRSASWNDAPGMMMKKEFRDE